MSQKIPLQLSDLEFQWLLLFVFNCRKGWTSWKILLFCAFGKIVFRESSELFGQEVKGFSFSKLSFIGFTSAQILLCSHPQNFGSLCNRENAVNKETSLVCRISGKFPGFIEPATLWHYVLPGCRSKFLQNPAEPNILMPLQHDPKSAPGPRLSHQCINKYILLFYTCYLCECSQHSYKEGIYYVTPFYR